MHLNDSISKIARVFKSFQLSWFLLFRSKAARLEACSQETGAQTKPFESSDPILHGEAGVGEM